MPSEFATEEARAVLREVKRMGSRFLIITMDGAMIPGIFSLLYEEEFSVQGGRLSALTISMRTRCTRTSTFQLAS